jgi:hypothetical protein
LQVNAGFSHIDLQAEMLTLLCPYTQLQHLSLCLHRLLLAANFQHRGKKHNKSSLYLSIDALISNPILHPNMVDQCTLGPDGQLLDMTEIKWYNNPNDTQSIQPTSGMQGAMFIYTTSSLGDY